MPDASFLPACVPRGGGKNRAQKGQRGHCVCGCCCCVVPAVILMLALVSSLSAFALVDHSYSARAWPVARWKGSLGVQNWHECRDFVICTGAFTPKPCFWSRLPDLGNGPLLMAESPQCPWTANIWLYTAMFISYLSEPHTQKHRWCSHWLPVLCQPTERKKLTWFW